MNELLFFVQSFLIFSFAFFALRLGSAALVTWVTVQALMANLFVLKQMTFFGFEVTASDAFAIGSLMGLNLLQEFFDQEEAKKATSVCFFFLLFFALMSQIHLYYLPSAHDTTQEAFTTLLSPSPRLFLASILTFFIVQQFDIRFFAFLQQKFPDYTFSSRVTFSLVVSQLLDTLLFSFLGLYGMVVSMSDIILVSFVLKVFCVLFFTTGMRLAKA